ncbi:heterogeneous nuclear ribonucleoprotein F-like [Planococcus citri]|uniref:heterogeneous nuclear ribonucleoprotein F-like n=1 Tax=Planococcus citri TaxID=170843 RepID=UPI0031F78F24
MENGTNDNENDNKSNIRAENNGNEGGESNIKTEGGDDGLDDCIVKMRGLPWSATVEDILSFLGECSVKGGKDGIHLTMSPLGRPSGEAYIELDTPDDAAKALKKDRQHMGHRYIEVFRTSRSEMDWVVSRCGMNMENVMDEGCIRMRGLPYGCTKEEVASFFSGLTIVPNGITFATDYTGRATGEAYVQFVNKENVEKALKKHMEKIGHRYIEIFRSSLAEIHSQTGPKMRSSLSGGLGRSTPYDRNERFGGPNRLGGGGGGGGGGSGGGNGGGPPSMNRLSRFRGDAEWDDYGDGYWNRGGPGPVGRAKPPLRGGGGGGGGGGYEDEEYMDGPRHFVHMRGLPYKAIEDDIAMFFRPLEPVDIRILFDKTERPSGEAVVEFASHEEAVEAMSKDKEHIQSRYIELFLDSVPDYKGDFPRSGPGLRPSIPRTRGAPFAGGGGGGGGSGGDRMRGSGFSGNSTRGGGQGTKPFMSTGGGGFRNSNW